MPRNRRLPDMIWVIICALILGDEVQPQLGGVVTPPVQLAIWYGKASQSQPRMRDGLVSACFAHISLVFQCRALLPPIRCEPTRKLLRMPSPDLFTLAYALAWFVILSVAGA